MAKMTEACVPNLMLVIPQLQTDCFSSCLIIHSSIGMCPYMYIYTCLVSCASTPNRQFWINYFDKMTTVSAKKIHPWINWSTLAPLRYGFTSSASAAGTTIHIQITLPLLGGVGVQKISISSPQQFHWYQETSSYPYPYPQPMILSDGHYICF